MQQADDGGATANDAPPLGQPRPTLPAGLKAIVLHRLALGVDAPRVLRGQPGKALGEDLPVAIAVLTAKAPDAEAQPDLSFPVVDRTESSHELEIRESSNKVEKMERIGWLLSGGDGHHAASRQ